jgi:hypothetical protein
VQSAQTELADRGWRAFNSNQRVDAIAQRSPETLDRGRSLHAPAIDDERADGVIYFFRRNEMRHAFH